jgi:F0F1-type ATP synthase delta subunit
VQAEDAVAGPYAKGLIDLAQEQNVLDNVYSDLMGLQVCFISAAALLSVDTCQQPASTLMHR